MTDQPPTIPAAPIAVIGATGQQGGAVVAALRHRGAPVRAIARDPGKVAGIGERGAELAVADLDDREALRRAFDGVAAVFAMTTMTGPSGTDGEVAHGRAIADAARAARVPHLVYSSVGGAERNTGIPHFESKWQVEQSLHEAGVPTVVIRPTFFMDNFLSLFTPATEGDSVVVRAPLVPGVPLQMIAVEDIGKAAATALLQSAAVPGGAVEIAGDERTPEAIADAVGAEQKLPARFEPLPIDAVGDDDAEAMFRWFTELPAYLADMERTRALVGELIDFPAFLARHPLRAT
ncbi:MAG: NmrA/HSCARG family protein [Solirubrobacterales bacterium]|nr:NmrA/HSCARG family protein [Solirubrobacterales bacterium]